jgi:hypothetical protein
MTFSTSLRALGLALLLGTSACAWNKTVINDSEFLSRAESIVVGQTKVQQLPDILGTTPLTWIETGDGRQVFVYLYGITKTEGFNIIILGISKTNTRIDAAYFVVDNAGVVSNKFVGTNSADVPWEWWAFGG